MDTCFCLSFRVTVTEGKVKAKVVGIQAIIARDLLNRESIEAIDPTK